MAVTTYEAAAVATVGVPEICPLAVLKLRPLGRGVSIDQLVADPPEFVGVSADIAVLSDAFKVVGEYAIDGLFPVTFTVIGSVSDVPEAGTAVKLTDLAPEDSEVEFVELYVTNLATAWAFAEVA